MRSKKAIYNIITSLTLQIIVFIHGLIIPQLIMKKFGSSVNGLVSSIAQFLTYISLLESGIGPVVKATLYKPIAQKNKEEICNILGATERFFRIIAIIFIIYIIILSIIYPIIVKNEFEIFYTMSLIIIISISTFAEYYFGMTYRLYLQAEQRTYVTSVIQIVSYIINTIFIAILIQNNCSIQIIKLATGLIFILRPLAQNIYVKRKYNINLKNVDKSYKLKQKWDGLSQHIAYVIHNNTDVTLLTMFSTLANVSVYTVYNSVTSALKNVIRSISSGIDATFGDIMAKNEQENLIKRFDMYETIYLMMCSIIYSCTIVLITPFITIYTRGINDANYTNYVFGTLISIGALLLTIKSIYNEIANSAGHFKEMRTGSIVEAIVNIIASIILVFNYGLIGVVIGTIFSVVIRIISLIIHVNKKILKRDIKLTIKKLLIITVNIIIVVYLSKYVARVEYSSYINWTINAILVFIEVCIITFIINIVFFKENINDFVIIMKNMYKRGKIKNEF